MNPDAEATAWAGRHVLVLAPTPTHPLDAGNRKRIHHVCRQLRDLGAAITFLHYPAEQDWREALPLESHRAMQEQWDATFIVPVTRPLHPAALASDHTIDEWWDPAIGDMLTWLFRSLHFDTFIVNYAWLSKAFEFCPRQVLKILDTHDRLSGRKAVLASHRIAAEFFHTTDAEEAIALNRADIVWSIKPDEARFFRSITARAVVNLPFVEPPRQPARRGDRASPIIRFGIVGAANSINRVNIEAFLDAAEEYVRRILLPCEFWIAGSCCALLRDRGLPYIRMLGRIDDIDRFYRDIDVVLAPITFSTGLKIKVGEALCAGKALIAHAHAMEGYHATHDFHALPSLAAMLRACRAIVADPGLIDLLEQRAEQSVAASRADWDAALTATLAASWRLDPGLCIVVAADAIFPGSLVLDHVAECAFYLGHVASVTIAIDGAAPLVAQPSAVQRLRGVGRVVSTARGDTVRARAPNDRPVARRSLDELFGDGHIAYWFASRPARMPRPRTRNAARAYISLDALACSGHGRDAATFMDEIEAAFEDVVVVRRRPMILHRDVVEGVRVRHYFAPFLWRGENSESIRAMAAASRDSIAILADALDDPLLHLCVAIVSRAGGRPIDIVMADDAGGPPPASLADAAAEGAPPAILRLNQYVGARCLGGSGPRLALDLSLSPEFDGLREALAGARVPVAELFASFARPVHGRWAPATSRAGLFASIEWLQTLLADDAVADALAAARDERDNYQADPGWTRVWQDLLDLQAARRAG